MNAAAPELSAGKYTLVSISSSTGSASAGGTIDTLTFELGPARYAEEDPRIGAP